MAANEIEKKNWDDLTPSEKRVIVVAGSVQVSLLAAAAVSLWRRPADEVRGGRKWPWALALPVNFVGPLAYLLCGRVKRS